MTTSKHEHQIIQQIDAKTVRQIVAGQAITDLASAVKELLDNALDAKAKSIKVKLVNYGVDSIEVADDGSGVPLDSRANLAVKHATSKIRGFEELNQSLGFRGEALFSLANTCKCLTVTTRTLDDVITGQKLYFDRSGALLVDKTVSVARSVGTTVIVEELFAALPVRRADLVKRAKAQWNKLLKLLQEYAVLCKGCKFHVINISSILSKTQTNTKKKGVALKKTEVKLATSNSSSLKHTISSIFGSKFLLGLEEINVTRSPSNDESGEDEFSMEGYVSKPPSSVADNVAREVQLFSINGRPVTLPKLSRLVVEVWRSYDSTGKRPACILNFNLPCKAYDVNLTADKREVLLSYETELFDSIRSSLNDLWGQKSGTFVQNEVFTASSASLDLHRGTNKMANNIMTLGAVKITKADDKPQCNIERIKYVSSNETDIEAKKSTALAQSSIKETSSVVKKKIEQEQEEEQEKISAAAITQETKNSSSFQNLVSSRVANKTNAASTLDSFVLKPSNQKMTGRPLQVFQSSFQKSQSSVKDHHQLQRVKESFSRKEYNASEQLSPKKKHSYSSVDPTSSSDEDFYDDIIPESKDEQKTKRQRREKIKSNESGMSGDSAEPSPLLRNRSKVTWNSFDTDDIISAYRFSRSFHKRTRRRFRDIKKKLAEQDKQEDSSLSDKYETINENKSNGKNVLISLDQKDFRKMFIIGQFNCGFVITRCERNHLWVFDQHACDERFNYERLCQTTVLHQQNLIQPLPLELSPSEEDCILENMKTFNQNGFKFEYDEIKPPRHRLSLTAIPHSGSGGNGYKAVQFGKDDVGALCSLLGADGTHSSSSGIGAKTGNNAVRRDAGRGSDGCSKKNDMIVRLPKAVSMFASRACRSSVMIGTALDAKQMSRIVSQMAHVLDPFHCAHGRPTIRHIVDVGDVLEKDECYVAQLMASANLELLTQE